MILLRVFAALLLTLVAFAATQADSYAVDATPSVSYGEVTAPPQYPTSVGSSSVAQSTSHCTYGRCFQQLMHASSMAEEFCNTYTKTINTQSDFAQTTFLSYCLDCPTEVSSACTCLMSRTQAPAASSTSAILQSTTVQSSKNQGSISASGLSSSTFQSVPPETFTTILTSGTSVITSIYTSIPPQRPGTLSTFTTVFSSGASLVTSTFVTIPSSSNQPGTSTSVQTSSTSKITSVLSSGASASVPPTTVTTVLTSGTSLATSVFVTTPASSAQPQTFTSVLTSGTTRITSIFTSIPSVPPPVSSIATFTSEGSTTHSTISASGSTNANSASQVESSLSGSTSGQPVTTIISGSSTITQGVSSDTVVASSSLGQSLTTFASGSLTVSQGVSSTNIPASGSGSTQSFATFTSGGSTVTQPIPSTSLPGSSSTAVQSSTTLTSGGSTVVVPISSTLPPVSSPSSAQSFTTLTSGGSSIVVPVSSTIPPASSSTAVQSFTTFTSGSSVTTQPLSSPTPVQTGSTSVGSGTSGVPPATSPTVITSGSTLATVPVSSAQSSVSAGGSASISLPTSISRSTGNPFSISLPSFGSSSTGGSFSISIPGSVGSSSTGGPVSISIPSVSSSSIGGSASISIPSAGSSSTGGSFSISIPASTTPASAGATPTSSGALQTSTSSGNVSTVSVTGTATLPTSGLTYQETSGLTGDEWITIVANGQTSTGLAVKGRNGHHDEIIWGLFSLAFGWEWNKKYDLRFPDLSFDLSFHWPKFPCLINCGGGGGGPPPIGGGGPPPDPPIEDPPEDENNSDTSTSSQSTSSSSSSSSCSVATVTDCLTSSIFLLDASGSTTSTITTTSCSTVSACSITASSSTTTSTSSASATPTWYLITPNYDAPRNVITDFTARLKQETNQSTFGISDAPFANYTAFWTQFLNSTQVDDYQNSPAVSHISLTDGEPTEPEIVEILNATTFNDPDTAADLTFAGDTILPPAKNTLRSFWNFLGQKVKRAPLPFPRDQLVQQIPADNHLKVISQPPGMAGSDMALLPDIESYAFQWEAQEPLARVYLVDSGVDRSSPSYHDYITNHGGEQPQWLFAGATVAPDPGFPFDFVYGQYNDYAANQHGTKMFSLITGNAHGVSKRTQVTIVRLPQPRRGRGDDPHRDVPTYRSAATVDALTMILEDIYERRRNGETNHGRVVINLAFGTARLGAALDIISIPRVGEDRYDYYRALQRLIAEDCVIVVASGNEATDTPPDGRDITGAPAVWRNRDCQLIVVGATDNYGYVLDSTQYTAGPNFPESQVDVWAPGDYVACDGVGYVTGGTSAACALTSGLIAYFLNTQNHYQAILERYNAAQTSPDPAERTWTFAVADYVRARSFQRHAQAIGRGPPVPVIYNGEDPRLTNNYYACGQDIPFPRKRQAGEECPVPDDPNAATIAWTNPAGNPWTMPTTNPDSAIPITTPPSSNPTQSTSFSTTSTEASPPTMTPTKPHQDGPHATCVSSFFNKSPDNAPIWLMADFDIGTNNMGLHVLDCAIKNNIQQHYTNQTSDFSQNNITPDGELWTANNIFSFKVGRDNWGSDPSVWECIVNIARTFGAKKDLGPCGLWKGPGGFNPPAMDYDL